MHCPYCGSEILDNSKFCPDCGENLEKGKIVIEETPLEKALTVRALEQKLDPTMEKRGEYSNFLQNIKAPKKKIWRKSSIRMKKSSVSGASVVYGVVAIIIVIGIIMFWVGIAPFFGGAPMVSPSTGVILIIIGAIIILISLCILTQGGCIDCCDYCD